MSEDALEVGAVAGAQTAAAPVAKPAPQAVSLGRRVREVGGMSLIYLFLTVMTIFSLFPLYFVVQASLRGTQNLYSTDLQLIPDHVTLDNFVYVLTQLSFINWVLNTFYVSGIATLLGLIVATTGAYAFSRFRFRGRQLGLRMLLAIQAFPALLAITAYYLLLQRLQLINTLEGLAMVYAAGAIAFAVWNIKGYFDTLPVELEQAAMVDGATPTQAFWRITLPLAAPVLATSALFILIGGWNEYALASWILNSNPTGSNLTFPVGIYGLQSDHRVPWGYFAAASVMVAIPLSIVFLWLQRFFQSGLTVGSVKG